MTRFFTLFCIVVLLGSSTLLAQGLTATPNPSSITGSASEGIKKAEVTITNTTGNPMTLAWVRLLNDIPPEWITSICDPILCYGPGQNEPRNTLGELVPFTLAAGASTSTFYTQFVPNDVSGTGSVRVLVYNVNDSANTNVLISFQADLLASAVESAPTLDDLISMGPNPAYNLLNVSVPADAGIRRAELYNIVGKRVLSYNVQSGTGKFAIDVSDLKEGIYFIRLIDGEGRLVSSRRFSKAN